MAGDWIKMRSNLHEDPRVIQIAASMSADELHVVGLLYRVWSWADCQSLNGDALCITETFLDRIVRRDGFAAALRKVGWLEGRDNALTFPRFAEHNGQTAKARALDNRRKADARELEKMSGSLSDICPVESRTREEKRREEKNNTLGKRSAGAEPASEEDWLKGLSSDPTYSGIDVPREFGRMTQWCKANHKQPTRRRFVNWLNRCDKPMNGHALHRPGPARVISRPQPHPDDAPV